MTNKEIVKQTSELLASNVFWEDIYERYANQIIKNSKKYKDNKKLFKVKSPLTIYSTISSVMSGSSYDLRFAGQSVGTISVEDDIVKLTVKNADYSREKFGFANSKVLKKVDWKTDEDAQSFRRFFYGLENNRKLKVKSQEHRLENFILKEFSKKHRAQKLLCNIQPVRLCGLFFQLTTPLKASSHQPTISLTNNNKGATGGGIDILARTLRSSNNVRRLAIIELKDENKSNEPQKEVMFQALIYATFVAHLLRSKSGEKWWKKIFRFGSSVDQHIDLDVVSLMPSGDPQEGELSPIELPKLNVTLHPYTLYFDVDSDGNPCAFDGTFSKELKMKK